MHSDAPPKDNNLVSITIGVAVAVTPFLARLPLLPYFGIKIFVLVALVDLEVRVFILILLPEVGGVAGHRDRVADDGIVLDP